MIKGGMRGLKMLINLKIAAQCVHKQHRHLPLLYEHGKAIICTCKLYENSNGLGLKF